jgi:hypothetical protein
MLDYAGFWYVSMREIVDFAHNIHELNLLHEYRFRNICPNQQCTGWTSINHSCDCGHSKNLYITWDDALDSSTFSLLCRAPLSQCFV